MARTHVRRLRHEELLRGAFKTIKREGLQWATLAKIAREVGVSKALVHHYFPNKRELVWQSLRYAHRLRRAALVRRLRGSEMPSNRLSAVFSVLLDPNYWHQGFCRAWISFLAEMSNDVQLARLGHALHAREQANLRHALKLLIEGEERAREIALGIKALVEGYRLRAGLWATDFDHQEVRKGIFDYLENVAPEISLKAGEDRSENGSQSTR